MSYKLVRFGSLTLPIYNPLTDISTGRSLTNAADLPGGGAFDMLGSDEAVFGSNMISLEAVLQEDVIADMTTAFNTLRGAVGKKTKLYREYPDGDIHYMISRLREMTGQKESKHINHLPVKLVFETIAPYWRGSLHGGWTLDSGEFLDDGLDLDSDETVTLDSSPKTFDVVHNGNAIVIDPLIVLTAGSAAITAFELTTDEINLEWSGTLAVGESLVIDCGAYSVKNDGVDDYANFDLGSGHAINEWMKIPPGTNSVSVTISGGNTDSTIEIIFREGNK